MAKPTVIVAYYSVYGHVRKLADKIVEGLNSAGNVDVKLYQFKENLPEDVLAMFKAPPQDPEVPFLTPEILGEADAFLMGIPTRYGSMPAQVKAFWDSTGPLWSTGKLVGKMGGFFFSTASQGGGQETTALVSLTNLIHHGIIYVPLGYTHNNLFDLSEVVGGSAYGAGTVAAGDGSRQPSVKELEVAEHQGKSFAAIVAKYHS
ncbi:hypothetical protein BB559_000756 [Furculomyces boomerangus]|uniref:Flavodoxin-like domain-containing protein n=2 Tax=Harpellales TaxID=61421 RepID=A0A2T9Y3V6_9FUNG|nr:hypothetical protein BB559_006259 [Furculomyces boomerangus]PVU91010.1 hypothetical protein BB559_004352 [Furculomyces boomerangus]PVU99393.1 hypothetical protein BB559_000756 [Furculomyces boomerangus]PWA01295.1 hypothetical protein BB558_002629 [Smittium angustum]